MEKDKELVEAAKLTETRKGEIALVLFKAEFIKEARSLNRTGVMRRIGQLAKDFEGLMTKEELIAFYKDLIEEANDKRFYHNKKNDKG